MYFSGLLFFGYPAEIRPCSFPHTLPAPRHSPGSYEYCSPLWQGQTYIVPKGGMLPAPPALSGQKSPPLSLPSGILRSNTRPGIRIFHSNMPFHLERSSYAPPLRSGNCSPAPDFHSCRPHRPPYCSGTGKKSVPYVPPGLLPRMPLHWHHLKNGRGRQKNG